MKYARAGRRLHLVAAAILGIGAFTLVLTVTDPPGPGLDPDAMSYMGAAESLAHHGQYRVPAAPWWSADTTAALTHFPPGYSTALALPVGLGMDPPQAARLVNALAAMVTVSTLALLVAEATTLAAGVLLGLALFVTPAMEMVHISVLSEPLFLAWTALMLAAMARCPSRPLAVGIPAALGALTRYAGVALVGAAALWMLADAGTLRERVRRAVIALLPAVVLQSAWLVRTRLLHEPAQIRHIAWYGDLGSTVGQGGRTLRDWLIPDPNAWSDPLPWRTALALAAGLVVAALVASGTRRALAHRRTLANGEPAAPGKPARLLAACALLIACYFGMLVVSRLFADPHIPFDGRILAPVVLLGSVAIAATMALWWRATPRMLPRIALGIGLACWWLAAAATSGGEVHYALTWGSDFAGEQWRRSELLDWARTEGADHPIYTNWPPALYFHMHRAARFVPGAGDSAHLGAFVDTLRAHDGRALVFSTPDPDYMTLESLQRAPGLRVTDTLADGMVLEAAPAGGRRIRH